MSCGLDICYCQSNSIIYNILYCFNTSHVTLYRKYSCQNSRRRWVSIHLMLLFISIRLVSSISAQSVSIHLMLLFISLCRQILLPDSPVSIHLMLLFIEKQRIAGESKGKFQYISCYSLSEKGTTFVPSVDTFQYISCYSLSARQAEYEHMRFTFQYISCYSLSVIERLQKDGYVRFNTSHVTLYRWSGRKGRGWHRFQYISCYSLSGTKSRSVSTVD